MKPINTKKRTTAYSELDRGVTLVELLVVIVIISTVALLVIPQVRTLSKERGRREAARIVASFFNEASTRAKSEGFAGVVIARNENFYRLVDANGTVPNTGGTGTVATGSKVYYSGQTLFQMKQPRIFSGNSESDVCQVAYTLPPGLYPSFQFTVQIAQPFDSRIKIEPGSAIYLGGSAAGYRINQVSVPAPAPGVPPQYVLTCFCERNENPPRNGSFKILPRPEIDVSTAVNLPKGHYVNLNYSGALDMSAPGTDLDVNDLTWTNLTQDFLPIDRTQIDAAYAAAHLTDVVRYPQFVDPNTQPVVITFGSHGEIDQVFPNGMLVDSWVETCKLLNLSGYTLTSPQQTRLKPIAPIMFSIAADELENTFELNNAAPGFEMPLSFYRASKDILNENSVQWVTVDHTSGWATVSDTIQQTAALVDPTPVPMAVLQGNRILNARGFATERNQAAD